MKAVKAAPRVFLALVMAFVLSFSTTLPATAATLTAGTTKTAATIAAKKTKTIYLKKKPTTVSAKLKVGNKLKLVSKQYHFYRQYLKHGVLTACLNTLRWGVSGIRKFSRNGMRA